MPRGLRGMQNFALIGADFTLQEQIAKKDASALFP
jgi:hypothetical protein